MGNNNGAIYSLCSERKEALCYSLVLHTAPLAVCTCVDLLSLCTCCGQHRFLKHTTYANTVTWLHVCTDQHITTLPNMCSWYACHHPLSLHHDHSVVYILLLLFLTSAQPRAPSHSFISVHYSTTTFLMCFTYHSFVSHHLHTALCPFPYCSLIFYVSWHNDTYELARSLVV